MLVEAAVKNGRLELSGREVPVGPSEGSGYSRSSHPGRRAVPGRQPWIRPVPIWIGMHMHPDPVALIRFDPHTPARASTARWRSMRCGADAGMNGVRCGVTDDYGYKKRRACSAARRDRFLAPYLTWRQEAANHHEQSIVTVSLRRLRVVVKP
jgi:hypothetical protein